MQAIADGVWEAPYTVRAGGVRFPGRMTVARLGDGGLALISPCPLDAGRITELQALGPVRHIVAPNLFHHLYAVAAKQAFPEAELYGPKGLQQKWPELASSPPRHPLELVDASGGALKALVMGGAPSIAETVFLHLPSKSLIVTDLVFNVLAPEGLMSRIAFLLGGTYKRFARSRLWSMATKDKQSMHESVDSLLAWDFERIIMAHGEIVESNAHRCLAAALGR